MASFFLRSVALAVALSVLAGVSLFAGGNLSPRLHEDRGHRRVIVVLALLGLLAVSLLQGMLPLILGRIVVVWWSMSNRLGLHEGVPCVPKG
jgi:MFS family permease